LRKQLDGPNEPPVTNGSQEPEKSLFKDEYFNETVILRPLSYVEPPNICDQNVQMINLENELNERFIWMNGMFLGYAKTAKRVSDKLDTYSFDMLCPDKRCESTKSETYNIWFLKRFTCTSKDDLFGKKTDGKTGNYYFTAEEVNFGSLLQSKDIGIFGSNAVVANQLTAPAQTQTPALKPAPAPAQALKPVQPQTPEPAPAVAQKKGRLSGLISPFSSSNPTAPGQPTQPKKTGWFSR
jgi:hypothetical protein